MASKASAGKITTAAMMFMIGSGAGVKIWNVTEQSPAERKMIPGTEWVPLGLIDRQSVTAMIHADDIVIVYGDDISCAYAQTAAERLLAFGVARVLIYEGGIREWQSHGQPVQCPAQSIQRVLAADADA